MLGYDKGRESRTINNRPLIDSSQGSVIIEHGKQERVCDSGVLSCGGRVCRVLMLSGQNVNVLQE